MEKEMEITERPWKVKGHIIDSHAISIGEVYYENEANAAHIVHCVNTHDELVEALELASREIATSLSLIYADTGKDYDTILREYPNYQKILSSLKKATN